MSLIRLCISSRPNVDLARGTLAAHWKRSAIGILLGTIWSASFIDRRIARITMPTIRRLRNRWQAMVRRKAIAPQCKSFDKRADAVQWARHLETEADRVGLSAGAPFLQRMTLGELLTRYRDQVSPNKRSAHSERAHIAAMILKPIAQRQLWKLTSADIANYRDERLLEV